MNWNGKDNKHYRGPIDRIYVSMTETYEVSYFIDQYLKTRGYDMTDENRTLVGKKLQLYAGGAPWKRDELNAFLDRGWKT